VAINKNKVFHSKDLFVRVCVLLMVWFDDVCKGLKKEKYRVNAVFLNAVPGVPGKQEMMVLISMDFSGHKGHHFQ
jgi:hypothetical protein